MKLKTYEKDDLTGRISDAIKLIWNIYGISTGSKDNRVYIANSTGLSAGHKVHWAVTWCINMFPDRLY